MSWAIDERHSIERQIQRVICHEIARGVYASGQTAPDPDALAQARILNPNAVRSAFAKLVELGLLEPLAGDGYRVAPGAAELARDWLADWASQELRDLVKHLRQAGVAAETIDRLLAEVRDA